MLSKGNKNIRREAASVRLRPARQRLCADNFSATERHDGLIVNHKIAAVNGVEQAVARRLDATQYSQDKERGKQAYQDAKGQPQKQLPVPGFSQRFERSPCNDGKPQFRDGLHNVH